MNDDHHARLYEIILDVVGPKFAQAGIDRNSIRPETELLDILDSFGIFDTLLEIEQRAEVSADLAQMDFTKAMTVGGLALEIVRINSPK